MPYVDYWSNLFALNDTFLDDMHNLAKSCGYAEYFSKYLTYPPPPGPFPVLPDPSIYNDTRCDVFDIVFAAELWVNPCFNIYHITDVCPFPYNSLGAVNEGDYVPPGFVSYFNRSDVQKAINAPIGTNWQQCTDLNVFANEPERSTNYSKSDTSLGPAQNGILQHVIEKTNNVIIGSGDLDMLLSTNGTLLAIQNMTWNGGQGLSEYPSKPFYVPYHPEYNRGALAGAGLLGSWGSERGLVSLPSSTT
jgi:carboxypeptidase D